MGMMKAMVTAMGQEEETSLTVACNVQAYRNLLVDTKLGVCTIDRIVSFRYQSLFILVT